MSTPTPPPYDQGPGYGAMPPAPPPPGGPPRQPPSTGQRRALALVIALGALVVILLVGAVVTAGVLIARRGDDGRTTASGSSPSAPVTGPGSGPSDSTVPTPTQDAGSADDGRLTASDFGGDWNFKLGDVELKATYVSSRDYPACGPIASPELEHLGCRYGALWVHEAHDGKLRMARVAYVYDSAAHAEAAVTRHKESDYQLPVEAEIAHFADGKWEAKSSDKVEIVTFVTIAAGVPEKDLDRYLGFGEADLLAALGFMDIS